MSLSIQHISKTYPNGVKALNDLSLEIPNGMFGLLGPNGAGKSSLMRTIATLQKPDIGSIFFDEINIQQNPLELRRKLGYLPQEFGVYENETAESLLDYFALLKGISSFKMRRNKVDEVLELTNLQEARKKKVSGYSGGMKRRFGIAQILLNDPSLIIVDEPTAGLDPAERSRFLNVIRSIGTSNTVIFSTHLVADVKELCQNMAIINNGSLILEGTITKSIQNLENQIWQTEIHPNQLSQLSMNFKVLSSSYQSDDLLLVRVYSEKAPSGSELQTLNWKNIDPDLSDVYFKTLDNVEIHV